MDGIVMCAYVKSPDHPRCAGPSDDRLSQCITMRETTCRCTVCRGRGGPWSRSRSGHEGRCVCRCKNEPMQGALLDRTTELDRLRTGIHAAQAGDSKFIVICGPAGVGKTRLLKESGDMAAAGLRLLRARGSEVERAYASGLVRQALEPLLRAASPDDRARWLAGAEAAEAAVARKPADGLPGPGEFAVFHGLFWLMSNLCQDGPVALLVDDLHWADEPSLRFLLHLLPRLEDLRLFLVATMRPDEPGAASHLLDVALSDQTCEILQPAPLQTASTGGLLADWFGKTPESGFVRACHQATGGNPLLVSELARAMTAEGLAPTDATASRVEELGARVLGRRVSVELGRLSGESVALAQAVAVLGAGAVPGQAAGLAGLDAYEAEQSVAHLQAAHLLRRREPGEPDLLDFVHPLIRATVYENVDPVKRVRLHARAVRVLSEAGARIEQVAAHVLQVPANAVPEAVPILRRAADEAMDAGAVEAALRYLQRATAETLPAQERVTVLTEAGSAAFMVDLPTAVAYFDEAVAATDDTATLTRLAAMQALASVLGAQDPVRADAVLREAIGHLPQDDTDARRALQATWLIAHLSASGWEKVAPELPALRRLPPASSVGAALLDAAIALFDTMAARPEAVVPTRRIMAEASLRKAATANALMLVNSCIPLLAHDPAEGLDVCESLIAETRRTGSLVTLCTLYSCRGWGWLLHGELAEAESDLREALRTAEVSSTVLTRQAALAWMVETLTEKGHLQEAEALLNAPHHGYDAASTVYLFQHSRAKLLHSLGRHEEALDAAFDAGRRFACYGGTNPALLPWRSQAALCLHALDRDEEARRLAAEELDFARQWGADHVIGRALRIYGLLHCGPEGIGLLEQAEKTLRHGPARLEHAKALVDLGSALRRANSRAKGRAYLAQGLELAHQCGSSLLTEHARDELRAAGARPRSPHMTGPQALTPSEMRVAKLAAQGLTNRQIAQQLYVTAKTVEVHLSAAYRKLGINRRTQLPHAIAAAP
ncbi:AAA family ATPase [Streptomyces actinomycinicus]|uniref:AAA family ATPase n=1 Tax=Streptomyces actinomycinicus TaxID=1695166 RepID=A0A937JMG0_9ACTN|nr:LuxR family transcriptional regulator [Streptomyces actinomycinicus]MBL1083485.1 AAA family ATPase [Streptomyces actinomycinicus]